jgi:hypothetical protein
MPWSSKQKKVIRAIEHGWKPPKGAPFEGMSRKWAAKMKKEDRARAQAEALRS